METVYFLGVDISKKCFDTALTVDGKHFHEMQVQNQAVAIQKFIKELKQKIRLDQLMVCMEHTGIYCLPLLEALLKYKVKVCMESGLQIQRSQGITRGKNDRIDAKRIALYAVKNREHLQCWRAHKDIVFRS
jgi:transposase